jgi:hypothetical protein
MTSKNPGADLIDRLDAKNRILVQQLKRSAFCERFFSDTTPTDVIEQMTANLLDQVHGYGNQLTRSISTALGRLASYPQWLSQIGPLYECLLGEIAHPQMAHEDSVKLAKTPGLPPRPTPTAFAVGAVARMLCEECHPLTHLGFFYLLEGTTSIMAPRLFEVLQARGIKSPFVTEHAVEDTKHAATLAEKVQEIVNIDPVVVGEIDYGYDCFATVYPLLVWNAALDRALSAD